MGKTWRDVNAIYQIAVRSFQDSNGDGIGDIQGVIQRLPYLKGEPDSLGVDAVMLTPFYPSPMRDFGYDISDFCAVAPEYGTLQDVDQLVAEVHARGMKIMFDLVVNHTSDQHEWFKASRSSRDNPKRDWYVWRDPQPDGSPPNNWVSKFGGSMWQFDEHTGQYFLHTFLDCQPDLNWQNPEVRAALKDVARFWLRRGADGFRVDAAIYIAKNFSYADNPPNQQYYEGDDTRYRFTENNISYGDDLQAFLTELAEVVHESNDTILTFEAYPEGTQLGVDRYESFAKMCPEHVAPMIIESTWVDPTTPDFTTLVADVKKYVSAHGSLAVFPLGNHDRSRAASHFGKRKMREVFEKQLQLDGLPIIYYGDEIGMEDVAVPPEKQTDFASQSFVGCRDPFRTPMQWDDSTYADFSTADPWLPLGDKTVNVAAQQHDPSSTFSVYKRFLSERTERLKKQHAPWRDVQALYQIYPRSFKDTDADGVGDLRGIAQKLSYVKTIADAVWLSPVYASPQKDFGYDVSSFVDIHDEYGTLEDFDRLVTQAHDEGLKVMMDLTPNHTSDQHEWFKTSRSSRDNPKRDWYVWRDPKKDGSPPNNWVSLAGGQSWTFDDTTKQFYLHSWMSNQPDLNWENPEVRAALCDVMRFWFDRGVDGFRIDAVWVLAKDPELRDDMLYDGHDGASYGDYQHIHCRNGKRLGEYLRVMADVAAEYSDKLLILEYYPSYEFGGAHQQLYQLQSLAAEHMTTFFFEAMNWSFDARTFGEGIAAFLRNKPAASLPVLTFGNHDQSRMATRFGGEGQARLLGFLQYVLPGMPCVYYGEELAMVDGVPPSAMRDGFGTEGMMGGRDPERTPMQWNSLPGAGFTDTHPWLPIHENHVEKNVEQQAAQPLSVLSLYRTLAQLRRQLPALRDGAFELLGYDNNILAFLRTDDSETYLVLANFSDVPQPVSVAGQVICSSQRGEFPKNVTELMAYEAVLVTHPGA